MTTATYTVNLSRKFIVAAVAITATAAAITSIPAPVFAADIAPATISAWQAQVERSIDKNLRTPDVMLANRDHAVAQVRLHTDSNGQVASIALAQSSGDAAVDVEALRTANAVHYPALPTAFRGRENNILMQVYFADSDTAAHDKAIAAMQTAAHSSAEQMSVEMATLANK